MRCEIIFSSVIAGAAGAGGAGGGGGASPKGTRWVLSSSRTPITDTPYNLFASTSGSAFRKPLEGLGCCDARVTGSP